ncbi:hypothetical protein Acr_04g0000390 [Actinidia rufa]|uniref:Uncharacterized protein n=1 Tax=Actinidia rufa TaxID=165716 RepID=A0A7J0EFR5_9ERIC|nr:hypothetical protein Acr_04g0000390 [Actinidia rufa]
MNHKNITHLLVGDMKEFIVDDTEEKIRTWRDWKNEIVLVEENMEKVAKTMANEALFQIWVYEMREKKSRIDICGGFAIEQSYCSQSLVGDVPSCTTEIVRMAIRAISGKWLFDYQLSKCLDALAVLSLDKLWLGVCSYASTVVLVNKDLFIDEFISVSGNWEFQSRDDSVYSFPRHNGCLPDNFNDQLKCRSKECKDAIQAVNNRQETKKSLEGSDSLPCALRVELHNAMPSAQKVPEPSSTRTFPKLKSRKKALPQARRAMPLLNLQTVKRKRKRKQSASSW